MNDLEESRLQALPSCASPASQLCLCIQYSASESNKNHAGNVFLIFSFFFFEGSDFAFHLLQKEREKRAS